MTGRKKTPLLFIPTQSPFVTKKVDFLFLLVSHASDGYSSVAALGFTPTFSLVVTPLELGFALRKRQPYFLKVNQLKLRASSLLFLCVLHINHQKASPST